MHRLEEPPPGKAGEWRQENQSSACRAVTPCLKKEKVTAHAFDPSNQRGRGGPLQAPHQPRFHTKACPRKEKNKQKQGRPVFSSAQLSRGTVSVTGSTLWLGFALTSPTAPPQLSTILCSFSPIMLQGSWQGALWSRSRVRGSGLAADSLPLPIDAEPGGVAREQGLRSKGRLKSWAKIFKGPVGHRVDFMPRTHLWG